MTDLTTPSSTATGGNYAVLDVGRKTLVHEVKINQRTGKARRGPVLRWPNYSLAAVAADRLTVRTGRAFFVREVPVNGSHAAS